MKHSKGKKLQEEQHAKHQSEKKVIYLSVLHRMQEVKVTTKNFVVTKNSFNIKTLMSDPL